MAIVVVMFALSVPAQVFNFAGAADATNTFTFTATESTIDVQTDGAPVTIIQSTVYTNVTAESGYDNFASATSKTYENILTKNGSNALKLTCTGVYNISIFTY